MQAIIPLILMFISASVYAGSFINYKVNNNDYEGYHIKPSGTAKGLVLLLHDWDGLTDYEVKRAKMLAAEGYQVFAADLYGKGNRPTETGAKKAETGKLYKDRPKMRSLILGALDKARSLGGGDAVVMGYCFGGAATLELARYGKAKNIKGYGSFHGGLTTPQGQAYSAESGPIFIAHGGADSSITMEHVADIANQMEKANVVYDIEVYSGAPHAFTVFGSKRYQKKADEKSWANFLSFLETNLSKTTGT